MYSELHDYNTFDTLKYADRLEKAGFTREQSKAEAEALADVLSSGSQEFVTTADLKSEVALVRSDMRELKAEMMGEMKLNRWMLAALVGMAIANFAKQFL